MISERGRRLREGKRMVESGKVVLREGACERKGKRVREKGVRAG